MTDGKSGEVSSQPLRDGDDSQKVISLVNQIIEQQSWGRQYLTMNLTPSQTEAIEPDVIITLHTAGLSLNIGPLQSVYHTGNESQRTQQQFVYDGYFQTLQAATIDSEINNSFRAYTTASLREETKQRLERQDLPSIIIIFGQSTAGITGIHLFFSQQYLPQEALDILKTHITAESLLLNSPRLPPNTLSDISSDTLQ